MKRSKMEKPKSGALSFSETIIEGKSCFLLFLASVSIYTYFFIPMEKQTFFGMLLKCLPIVSLQISLLIKPKSGPDGVYQQKILAGLILSSIGDAFLDFPGYFLHGTVPFAFAQMCYIWAFGITPLKTKVGLIILGIMSLPIMFITTNLMKEEFKLLIVISLYAPLLKVMVWRAVSRIDCCSASKKSTDWPQVFGGLGAISFGLSDASLALNKYYTPIPYAQPIIMSTYYLAQLGITLSTVTRSGSAQPKKKSK